MAKTIILTGGGTAGHVTPNIALLPGLRARGVNVRYIGSYDGMEKGMIEAQGIPYDGIATGKFRRNLSLKNIKDAFRVLKGLKEARALMRKYRPDLVFSKGGYVAVPVVWAAKKYQIPIIIHESDITPGLANRLCFRKATRILCNFPETVALLPAEKARLSGSPIREELLSGNREAGLRFAGFSGKKPVLLMIGGSTGAMKLNRILRDALPALLPRFDVIHLCGKGNLKEKLFETEGYVQFEFVSEELKDVFACSDLVFSRAGANAICELLALKKPNLLVPLPKDNSRGDQLLNAASFEKQGFSKVILQEDLTPEILAEALNEVYDRRASYIQAMEKSTQKSGVQTVLEEIDKLLSD